MAVGWSQHDTVEDIHASLVALTVPSDPHRPASLASPPHHPHSPGVPAAQYIEHAKLLSSSPPFLALTCDVRIPSTIASVFSATLAFAGRYDIVVSCAGYGLIGPCEEQGEFEIRGQVETNFWGVMNVLQLSLPYFRSRSQSLSEKRQEEGDSDGDAEGEEEDGEGEGRGGGRYLIFSSTSGSLGVPGLGPYCATKFAVEGLVESLLYETAGCDIRATLVEPGHVRRDDEGNGAAAASLAREKKGQAVTNGAGAGTGADKNIGKDKWREYGHFRVLESPKESPYAKPTAPAKHAERVMQWLGERQPTSAAKAAELVWQLGHCRYPPLRLLLGAFAVESVRERMRGITEEIEDWKSLSFPLTGEDGDTAMSTPVKRKGRGIRHQDEGDAGSGYEDSDDDVKMEDEIEEDDER